MSSPAVRDAFNAKIAEIADPVPVYDLSDWVANMHELPQVDDLTLLVQYSVSDEIPMSVVNNCGYEEDGVITLHTVTPTGFDSAPAVLFNTKVSRNLNGLRINKELTIESAEQFVDFGGEPTGLSGSWHTWSSNLFYINRECG